eukprot:7869859-Ditylum_brightwellii.AAC.1
MPLGGTPSGLYRLPMVGIRSPANLPSPPFCPTSSPTPPQSARASSSAPQHLAPEPPLSPASEPPLRPHRPPICRAASPLALPRSARRRCNPGC